MVSVHEDRIFAGGETYGCEFSRKPRGILHFDTREVFEFTPRRYVPTNAIGNLTYPSGDLADFRDEPFPLHGNLDAGFERIALVQTGDNDLLGMLKAGCSETQRLSANAGFLPTKFRRKLGAEVLRFENLANLDLAILVVRIGAALDPLDRLFLRLAPPQPVAGDKFFGLDEGPVDHGALAAGEPDTRAFGGRMQSLPRKHHAGLHQLFIELAHLGEESLAKAEQQLQQDNYGAALFFALKVQDLAVKAQDFPPARRPAPDPEKPPAKASYVVKASVANIRLEPATSAPVVGTAPRGATLSASAERGNWVQVSYGEVKGWVSRSLLE